MAVKPINNMRAVLGSDKYKSYTGDYFNSRLDMTLANELTTRELNQIKENSISRIISVQNSLNAIHSSLAAAG